ncbi:hypothetical protein GCM10011532_10480 [Christiangramia forsetii]|nr:hypothetical protein GCM10011532_10480 [Christiangramia forsetii]
MVLAFLLLGSPANAQFLKKLKKKVEQKVENTVTENISNKAAEETDKSLNNIWENNMDLGLSQVDYSEIPDTYQFSWKYDMTIETKDGATDLVYLFEEDASYLGTIINQEDNKMIMVFDPLANLNTMYMNNDGSKMVMGTKMKINAKDVEEMSDYENMQITEIGKKKILGYDCNGYRMENDEYIVTSYLTEETNLNFASMFQSKGNPKIPKAVDAEWFKKHSDGLMLEMEVIDKNKGKDNMKMYCTSLSKENFQINKSDYNSM